MPLMRRSHPGPTFEDVRPQEPSPTVVAQVLADRGMREPRPASKQDVEFVVTVLDKDQLSKLVPWGAVHEVKRVLVIKGWGEGSVTALVKVIVNSSDGNARHDITKWLDQCDFTRFPRSPRQYFLGLAPGGQGAHTAGG